MNDLDLRLRRALERLAQPGRPAAVLDRVRLTVRRRRRRRSSLIAGAVVIVVAGGLGTWLAIRQPGPSSSLVIASAPPTSSDVRDCNVHHERTLAQGRLTERRHVSGSALVEQTWKLTGDASPAQHRAVIVVYIGGQDYQSQCIDPQSWTTLIDQGPSSWSFATSTPPSFRITVLFGVIPYEVAQVRVTLANGHTTTARPAATALGLPFRFFALAVPANQVVTTATAENSQDQTIINAAFVGYGRSTPEPIGGGGFGTFRINPAEVHLPLQRPPHPSG